MNCEEMLVEQVAKTTAASPDTTVWVRCTFSTESMVRDRVRVRVAV
jgi:hypothetical protein